MKTLTAGDVPLEEASLDLGKVLGQSLAFGTIAGRCSAAQAAAIREAHNQKVHTRLGMKWKEFCPKHLKMSGTQAEDIIGLLEEFGPSYFEHTHSVRISREMYRLVSPFIMDKQLHVEGNVLELNSANVQKVAISVRQSRRALLPPAETPQESLSGQFVELNRSAAELVGQFREIGRRRRKTESAPFFDSQFRGAFAKLSSELKRVGLENGIA